MYFFALAADYDGTLALDGGTNVLEGPIPMQLRSTRFRLVALCAALLAVCVAPPDRALADERVVVCLGDSLTEGYGLAPEQSYPSLLERMLRDRGHAGRVVNAGVSGSTSASAASRLRWQLRSRPDVVVIALGANDGLRGVDVAATKGKLSAGDRV